MNQVPENLYLGRLPYITKNYPAQIEPVQDKYIYIFTCKIMIFYTHLNNMLCIILLLDPDGPVVIEADPDTNHATRLWDKMKVEGINRNHHKTDNLIDPKIPVSEDNIRFVCISDTHATIEKQPVAFVPVGDVLIHAGDITNVGQPHEIKRFNEYLGKNCMHMKM
jgi:hypothetical protein